MKTPEEIQKEIDDIVDIEVEKAINKVEKEIDKDVEMEIKEAVEKKVKEKIESVVSNDLNARQAVPLIPVSSRPELSRRVSLIKQSFHVCWAGTCRSIAWVFLIVYLLVIGLMVTCGFSNASICLVRGYGGAMPYIIIGVISASIIVTFMSFFAPNPKIAFIFGLILDVPLIILVIFMTAQYIGLIIIALVILARIIQGTRFSGR